jgi:hypothetical protein
VGSRFKGLCRLTFVCLLNARRNQGHKQFRPIQRPQKPVLLATRLVSPIMPKPCYGGSEGKSMKAVELAALKRVVGVKSPYHNFALSFRLSSDQKAQSCDNAITTSTSNCSSYLATSLVFTGASYNVRP